MYINKVTIMGNLTRDPEMKAIPSGMKVATFSIATNRTWKDASGVKKDSVEYHNIVCFGRQAEVVNQYCKKGSSLYLEGRLQTRSWDDQSGVKKYRTEIILDSFQFGPKAAGSTGSYEPADKEAPSGSPASQNDDLDTIEYPADDFENINIEDIPF